MVEEEEERMTMIAKLPLKSAGGCRSGFSRKKGEAD